MKPTHPSLIFDNWVVVPNCEELKGVFAAYSSKASCQLIAMELNAGASETQWSWSKNPQARGTDYWAVIPRRDYNRLVAPETNEWGIISP